MFLVLASLHCYVNALVLCLVERTGKKMTCLWTDEEVCRGGQRFYIALFVLSGNSNFGVSVVSSV